ncbi:MAG: 50S ribosome-binding GTPase [Candidatus Nanoarchaeia archaeon]|nr:50S ribosome-binding GTPase [Candidatus Nanoarchaeia archaeon]MDD5741407.1 50S ribosome-binding GTPase [Candidatus Nanoarchaeia archaeon]
MPINANFEFANAQEKYYSASTDEEKLEALEEMLRTMPSHKGAENLRKNLRTRYKKLKQEIEKSKKRKGSGKSGIKKGEMQAVLVGLTNSGKSSILKILTNTQPKIASYGFTTTSPEIGILNYANCNIQIVDLPPIASESFDKGIVNSADTLLMVIEKIHEIPAVMEQTRQNKKAEKIIIFNKMDLYDEEIKRKIKETLRSKKYNFSMISTFTKEGVEDLKEKIFKSFKIIRVYTKHPGKREKLDNVPVVLQPNSTLQDVAEKILHGYSKKVKYAKITGPSCKFPNQKVGLKHIVQDKDIVEFFTE